MRHKTHPESYNPPHESCEDLACCLCECHGCKRAWFAAGRPAPRNCKLPGLKTEGVPVPWEDDPNWKPPS